jgi:hypothetical protein
MAEKKENAINLLALITSKGNTSATPHASPRATNTKREVSRLERAALDLPFTA